MIADAWTVRASDWRERVRRGVLVSGARITILCGFEGFGTISMGSVVAAESSRVGCMRQYLLLSLSHSSMLASCSCALLMASACRSALAFRLSLWATATLEEWSSAIRPASLGKVQVTRGSADVGFSRAVSGVDAGNGDFGVGGFEGVDRIGCGGIESDDFSANSQVIAVHSL